MVSYAINIEKSLYCFRFSSRLQNYVFSSALGKFSLSGGDRVKGVMLEKGVMGPGNRRLKLYGQVTLLTTTALTVYSLPKWAPLCNILSHTIGQNCRFFRHFTMLSNILNTCLKIAYRWNCQIRTTGIAPLHSTLYTEGKKREKNL